MFDYRNTGLYPSAFRAYLDNFALVLICSVIFVVLEYVNIRFDYKASYWMPIIVEIWFVYHIHRTILNGVADRITVGSSTGTTFVSFMWRSLLLFFVMMAPIVPLGIAAFIFRDKFADDTEILVGGFVLIGLPTYGIFLSVFGTVLPAAVAGVDKSFKAARRRSHGQVLSTLWKYIYGPGLFVIFAIALSFGLRALGLPTEMFTASNTLVPFGTVGAFLMELIGLFTATLAVTILCKAYLNATPQTDNT